MSFMKINQQYPYNLVNIDDISTIIDINNYDDYHKTSTKAVIILKYGHKIETTDTIDMIINKLKQCEHSAIIAS